MKAAIRLDDITADMDWEKFYKMKTILDTYQIKPLIGVVPFNQDPNLKRQEKIKDFGEFLRKCKQEGYSIALHGYQHVYVNKKGGIFPLNDLSEYAGISLEKQKSMIEEGKHRLEDWGVGTDIFMAPAHSFDKNTIKALKECGFVSITDGFGKKPYIRNGLTFFPISMKRTDCISEKEGYTTLVLHTNTMDETEFESCEKMIREHRECFISYSDYLKVKAEQRNIFGNIWEYSTAKAKFYLVRLRAMLKKRVSK